MTRPTGKPPGRPKKPVDPNPPPKRSVGRPRKDHPVDAQLLDEYLAMTFAAPKSADETERKREFRAEARKYDSIMLRNLAHLALTADHIASRVKATEAVLHLGHGRPSTVQSELPTQHLVPNFQIFFGNPDQVRPTLTIQHPFKIEDE